ncbi:hypothetical protein BGZ50_008860 [Haplosporangium sp. Z 11]|nr:hypothetical protein BGZ50_008860 [Haplosporangium sp. Z 11]
MVSPAHPFEPKSLVLNSNWKSTYTLNRFRLELIAQIKKRLLISDAYLMASALHPTFNALWFLDDEERFDSIKGKLCEEFKQITPKETRQPKRNVSRHLTKKNDKSVHLSYTNFSSGDESRER